jgi:acetyl esterase/lipase
MLRIFVVSTVALLASVLGCSSGSGGGADVGTLEGDAVGLDSGWEVSESDAGDLVLPPDVSSDDSEVLPGDTIDAEEVGEDPDASDLGDVTDDTLLPTPYQPEIEYCGKEPHKWLERSEVGDVVSWKEHLLSNLKISDIEALVPEGYEYLLPVQYGVRNFQLRYTTQDRGQKVEATAIVGVPVGPGLDKPLPVVVFQHGTTGFMDDCAPSKSLEEGVLPSLVLSTRGYISVSPDYIGMVGFGAKSPEGTIHPYLVGEATAIASLDAVRATVAALEADSALPQGDVTRVALFGGSQGGHAAFFTELFAPYYAPEFGIAGAVAVVPPTDLRVHAQDGCANIVDSTGNLIAALIAMWDWYGRRWEMGSALTDEEPLTLATTLPELMASTCKISGSGYQDVTSTEQVFSEPFRTSCINGDWAVVPNWSCVLAENSLLTTSVPRISDTPFLVIFGENDTLVVTAFERPLMEKLCEEGYRLQYRECAGASHTGAAADSAPMIIKWLADRFSGEPLSEGDNCVMHSAAEMCAPAL